MISHLQSGTLTRTLTHFFFTLTQRNRPEGLLPFCFAAVFVLQLCFNLCFLVVCLLYIHTCVSWLRFTVLRHVHTFVLVGNFFREAFMDTLTYVCIYYTRHNSSWQPCRNNMGFHNKFLIQNFFLKLISLHCLCRFQQKNRIILLDPKLKQLEAQ